MKEVWRRGGGDGEGKELQREDLESRVNRVFCSSILKLGVFSAGNNCSV